MAAAAARRIMIATATNVPATFPELAKKPPLLSASVTEVVVTAGGAVGVMVSVLTSPVTVITDVTGMGVHVAEVLEEVVLVGDVVGVVGVVSIVGAAGVGVGVDEVVEVVTGLRVIETGINVVCNVLVGVDVVEGV